MLKFIFILLLICFCSYSGFITKQSYALLPKKELALQIVKADRILVQKRKRKLFLLKEGEVFRDYTISLGFAPVGPKQQKGDGKTPEGSYRICAKNPNSQFHRSLKISYPNVQDEKNAAINKTAPGDHIMIHGLKWNFAWLGKIHTLKDWTLGCIAVTNPEIEEIWELVDIGTPIDIEP